MLRIAGAEQGDERPSINDDVSCHASRRPGLLLRGIVYWSMHRADRGRIRPNLPRDRRSSTHRAFAAARAEPIRAFRELPSIEIRAAAWLPLPVADEV